MKKILAIDIGSSSIKAGIYQLDKEIDVLCSFTENIGIYSPMPGYVENKPEEIWEKLCAVINKTLVNSNISSDDIGIVSICSQAQSVVMVDRFGNALTPIYNSQDGRAVDSFKKYYSKGFQIESLNVIKLLKCYFATGFMPVSAKDPVFKNKWVQDHYPEIYNKTYKWIDVKDYIICCLTGEIATTKDNAHAYTIYNSRKNDGKWSKTVAKVFEVDVDKLPKIVDSTDIVGRTSKEAAKRTGLPIDTPVIGGVIDSTAVQYGSGAADVGEEMMYWGTSGWVGTVLDKMRIDPLNKVGALVTALDKKYHYYACLDSAGISYKWLMEHIVLDDGLLGDSSKKDYSDDAVYDYMNKSLSKVSAGSDGLMYAPWLTGCRAPMEASNIGGMFVNFKHYMDKKYFVRAVVEGICYQFRWLKEISTKKVSDVKTIRFVGGGANSDEVCQILADIIGCEVEVPKNPQDAGAIGAAIVGFCALDKSVSIVDMSHRQSVDRRFVPNMDIHKKYDKYYKVFKTLYKHNKKILSSLSKINEEDA